MYIVFESLPLFSFSSFCHMSLLFSISKQDCTCVCLQILHLEAHYFLKYCLADLHNFKSSSSFVFLNLFSAVLFLPLAIWHSLSHHYGWLISTWFSIFISSAQNSNILHIVKTALLIRVCSTWLLKSDSKFLLCSQSNLLRNKAHFLSSCLNLTISSLSVFFYKTPLPPLLYCLLIHIW